MAEQEENWTKGMRWFIAVGYVLCWILGILVGGPTLTPDADAAEITAEFGGSQSHLAFAVLVHGIAAVLLVALGLSLSSKNRPRTVIALASTAATLSIVQLIGKVLLVAAQTDIPATFLWELITRVDGIKMIVLAGLIAFVHGGSFRERVTLTVVSAAAGATLLLSGIGYLALLPSLMDVTTASLPLLLIWSLVATASQVSRSQKSKAPHRMD